MSLNAPIGIYGLWNVTFKDRVTKLPQAIIKVAAEFTMPFSADMEDYVGGGAKYTLASEPKYVKADASFDIKQFNSASYVYLGSGALSAGTAEAAGAVTTLTNQHGTSIKSSTTGIASVGLTSAATAELKTGDYTIIATSTTAVDVYCDSDADFSGTWTGGTAKTFVDDTCKITSAPLTISTSGVATALSGFGIELIGGSGTIGMTAGDTATFSVRAANIANEEVILGGDGMFFKSYSVSATSVPKSLTGEIYSIYMPIVQVSGLDLSLKEYAWMNAAPKLKVLRSQSEAMVAKIKRLQRIAA